MVYPKQRKRSLPNRYHCIQYYFCQCVSPKFVEIQPNHATAYFLLGTIHTHQVNQKNYQQRAEVYFTKAIALKPEFAEAYNSRGLVRQELKNYLGAKADLNKAAQLFVEQRNMDRYQEVQQTLRMLP